MLNFILYMVESDSDRLLVTMLYEEYSKQLYMFALKHLCDEDYANDITQNTYLTLIRHLDKLRHQDRKSIYAYLFTVQKNAIKKQYIKNKRNQNNVSFEILNDIPSEDDIDKILTANERYNIIVRSISDLPQIYSDVLLLHLVNEIPLKDVSDILNEPYSTVRKHYSRGRQMLAIALKKEEKNGKI